MTVLGQRERTWDRSNTDDLVVGLRPSGWNTKGTVGTLLGWPNPFRLGTRSLSFTFKVGGGIVLFQISKNECLGPVPSHVTQTSLQETGTQCVPSFLQCISLSRVYTVTRYMYSLTPHLVKFQCPFPDLPDKFPLPTFHPSGQTITNRGRWWNLVYSNRNLNLWYSSHRLRTKTILVQFKHKFNLRFCILTFLHDVRGPNTT